MLNQSFSFENLRTIHEIENRKGNYYKDFYSAEYNEIVNLLQEKRKEIKLEKVKLIFNEEVFSKLQDEKKILEENKDSFLETDLNKFSNKINEKSFDLKLTSFTPEQGAKAIYTTSKDAVSFFAMKQLQYNLYRIFKVKQSNRYQIVKQVKTLLQDDFPKFIIRTDIRQFYESVPQYDLLKLIENNSLLSPKSKSLIKNLLYNYNKLTNQLILNEKSRKGIPRGVGISPYLAELYMRKIDNEIKSISDVFFYGRYVDDIIIFFAPKTKYTNNLFLSEIKKIINNNGLQIKDGTIPQEISKTNEIDLLNDKTTNQDINFLGYKFVIRNSKLLNIKLSDNKIKKYHERIEKSINQYLISKTNNELDARKLLIHRFSYLTKNTKLHKPKKGLIGIYYSNSLIETDCKCLNDLDSKLNIIIDQNLPALNYPNLNNRLKKFSFKKGFSDKLFFNINSKRKKIPDLRSATEKRTKPLMNNFEKIVEVWK